MNKTKFICAYREKTFAVKFNKTLCKEIGPAGYNDCNLIQLAHLASLSTCQAKRIDVFHISITIH